MRLIHLTLARVEELKDERVLVPVWIDADRVVAITPNFRSETWGGRTYSIPDGTGVLLEGDERATVRECIETVVALVAGEPA